MSTAAASAAATANPHRRQTPLFSGAKTLPTSLALLSPPRRAATAAVPRRRRRSPARATADATPPGDGAQDQEEGIRAKLAKLGLAAVLAYGIFDGVTYTSFFTLAFLGYEKSTGRNPAANLRALLGIVVLMWTGNNVTRPFRVAGAAALAPAVDELLKRFQRRLKLRRQIQAFALAAAAVAGACLSVVALLILSRWGK
ncbi:uncharacterized protein LOC144711647 [Wolffia australiana]